MISARQSSVSPPGTLDRRMASATVSSSTFGSKGLVRKPNTPRRVAVTASGMVPCAVRMTTGSEGDSRWMASNSAMPSMPSMRRSVTTTCGRDTASAASAACARLRPRSPRSRRPSGASRSAAAGPCRRRPAGPAPRSRAVRGFIACAVRSFSSRSRIPRSIARSASSCCFIASSRLSRSLSGHCALAPHALGARRAGARFRARCAWRSAICAGQQRGEAADARRAGVGDRLEQLDRARVVAQRGRQGSEQRGEPQAVGRRAARQRLLRPAEGRLLLRERRARRDHRFGDDAVDRVRLQRGTPRQGHDEQASQRLMPRSAAAARRGNARRAPPPAR